MDQQRIGEILAPATAETTAGRERRVRAGFFRTLRRAAGQVPFMDELVAAYFCAIDGKTPARARGMLLAALAYFVLPLDVVPDFILGIGFTDDLAVLTAAITAVRPHIRPAHRRKARDFLQMSD